MNKYKIQISLLSAVLTPFHSDTLWGHICWAIRYLDGEGELEKFLQCYSDDKPPLIISSAFPQGYLPFPVLPPMDKETMKELSKKYWGEYQIVNGVSGLKWLFQLPYLSKAVLDNLKNEKLSKETLANHFLGNPNYCPRTAGYLPEPCKKKFDDNKKITCSILAFSQDECPEEFEKIWHGKRIEQEITYHVKINRLSGTALDRALFTTEDTFSGCDTMEAYCMIDGSFTKERLRQCLNFISDSGYGKDKSSGKGAVSFTITDSDIGDPATSANAFMSLSNYVPCETDQTQGFYKLFTKYGKLGGHFANSPVISGKEPLPYKYPLIMFEAGSVFKMDQTRDCFGRIVEKIHPADNPKIAHYGYTYPFYIQIGW